MTGKCSYAFVNTKNRNNNDNNYDDDEDDKNPFAELSHYVC